MTIEPEIQCLQRPSEGWMIGCPLTLPKVQSWKDQWIMLALTLALSPRRGNTCQISLDMLSTHCRLLGPVAGWHEW